MAFSAAAFQGKLPFLGTWSFFIVCGWPAAADGWLVGWLRGGLVVCLSLYLESVIRVVCLFVLCSCL